MKRDKRSLKTDEQASGVTQEALDPLQEVDTMGDYVSFEEYQQYFSADCEYAECVFARNGLEEEEEGIADEICYIVSVDEGDQD